MNDVDWSSSGYQHRKSNFPLTAPTPALQGVQVRTRAFGGRCPAIPIELARDLAPPSQHLDELLETVGLVLARESNDPSGVDQSTQVHRAPLIVGMGIGRPYAKPEGMQMGCSGVPERRSPEFISELELGSASPYRKTGKAMFWGISRTLETILLIRRQEFIRQPSSRRSIATARTLSVFSV